MERDYDKKKDEEEEENDSMKWTIVGTKWQCIDITTGMSTMIENLVYEGNKIYISKIS